MNPQKTVPRRNGARKSTYVSGQRNYKPTDAQLLAARRFYGLPDPSKSWTPWTITTSSDGRVVHHRELLKQETPQKKVNSYKRSVMLARNDVQLQQRFNFLVGNSDD
jgi:hypothetical protein